MTPSRRLPTGHWATSSPNGCGAASRSGSGRRCGKTLPPGWLETEDERMIRATITMFLAVAASAATVASKAATTTGADPLAIFGATLVNPEAQPVSDAVVVVRHVRLVAPGPRDAVDLAAGTIRGPAPAQ